MKPKDPEKRRRSAGAIAAICGGSAASMSAISATGHNAKSVVLQDVGIAAAIVLIIIALVACVVAARRHPS